MAKKRVTALLTLLLSLVLILPCLVGCDNAPEEKDCPEMVTYDIDFLYGGAQSYRGPIKVTLSLEPNVDFECKTSGEPYLLDNQLSPKTIKSGETIELFVPANYDKSKKTDDGYISIIARHNNHIVGYIILVLKAEYNDSFSDYYVVDHWKLSIAKSVEFPQIDGQYQDVSEEYVQRQFKKLIKK